MNEMFLSLFNIVYWFTETLTSQIFFLGYTFFEYISTSLYLLITELYHLSFKLCGPGWSSDFLRLFQSGNRLEMTTRLNTWQYWWWFWFCFGWAYYDGFFKRILCFKNFRVFISIYTSLRPHGKFGDFIACIIPAAWVINIVFNSNSLLKLSEWQNDTTVFSIRIRARQWYWLYYYDFKHLFEIFTLPKQIGWNGWRCDGFGVTRYYSSYITALESRSRDFSGAFEYWDDKVSDLIKSNYIKKQRPKLVAIFDEKLQVKENTLNTEDLGMSFKNETPFKKKQLPADLTNHLVQEFTKKIENKSQNIELNLKVEEKGSVTFFKNSIIFKEINRKLNDYKNQYSSLFDIDLNKSKGIILKKPRKLIYDSLSSDSLDSFYFDGQKSNHKFLTVKLNLKDSNLQFLTRINPNSYLNLEWWDNRGLTLLLQKRLESPDLVPADFLRSTQKIDYRLSTLKGIRCFLDTKAKSYTRNLGFLTTTDLDVVEHNKFTRNSIKPSFHQPTQFSKRLLRVTKTFVLPSLVSLNVMTNSYDVVHSWFVPALCIKFDCVPGKSTHHLLYIEYIGFFYGQCAEICGRYHHHMPIRIFSCTLSYFMAWWSHIGFFKAISLNPYTEFNEEPLDNLYIQDEPYWTGSRSNYIW